MKELQSLFVPRASMELARVDLDMIAQKPNEELPIYHARCRFVYIMAYPEDNAETSEIAIRSFIKGLTSTSLKDYVMLKRPQTFSSALTLAQEKLGVERLVQHYAYGAPDPTPMAAPGTKEGPP